MRAIDSETLDSTSIRRGRSSQKRVNLSAPEGLGDGLGVAPLLKDLRTIKHLPVLSIASKLALQRTLTAVEQFAERHETGEHPVQAKYYRSLLPTTRPNQGEQYAFEVDLDRCTGCKACVSACHSLNGLDEGELWRNVGTVQSLEETHPRIQTVTSSCHHCVEPACLKGCPVGAYEKHEITGIVKHLDDQCFGCQYCTLMCPYDAPKFSPSRGIVRKCDMCSQRLEDGEAPACVQACPNEAIAIRIVERSEVAVLAGKGEFVGGAPSPKATLPTTRYKSARKADAELVAVDRDVTRVEHMHLPLVIMLTLTQLGVGTLLFSLLFERFDGGNPRASVLMPAVAFGGTAIALLASVFHLGRPWLAWRAVLNLKTSWLSREALAFGLFAKSLAFYCLSMLPEPGLQIPGYRLLVSLSIPLAIASSVFGLAGVTCSVMVYVATKRAHWAWPRTSAAFFGSLVLLGAAMASVIVSSTSNVRVAPTVGMVFACGTVMVFACAKLIFEHRHLRAVRHGDRSVMQMAKTIRERMKTLTLLRGIVGVVGGIALPLLMIADVVALEWWSSVACGSLLLVLAGEILERMMFFCAAPASRMPGALP